MDQVLADFDKAAREHMKPASGKWKQLVDEFGRHDIVSHDSTTDEVKRFIRHLRSDGHNLGTSTARHYAKVAQTYVDDFYKLFGRKGFFRNLEILDGAHRLVEHSLELSNGNVCVLTAPVRSEWCVPEKIEWIGHHFPNVFREFYADAKKHLYCDGPGSILVDDRTKNTVPWEEAGGTAFLYTGDTETTCRDMSEFVRVYESARL